MTNTKEIVWGGCNVPNCLFLRGNPDDIFGPIKPHELCHRDGALDGPEFYLLTGEEADNPTNRSSYTPLPHGGMLLNWRLARRNCLLLLHILQPLLLEAREPRSRKKKVLPPTWHFEPLAIFLYSVQRPFVPTSNLS